MNARQEKIVELLQSSEKWITGKELAAILNVSDRTIRADIETINKTYDDLIQASFRNGYHINREVIANLKITINNDIPQTSDERCKYILKTLLLKNSHINLNHLQDKIFVSEFTIEADIKKIKKHLEEFSTLRIIRKNNYIHLEGNEVDKRMLYKEMLTLETKGNFINMNSIASFYREFDLLIIKNMLEEMLDKYDYKIREESFPMLMIHIGIAIQRMMDSNYIQTDYKTKDIMDSMEFIIINEFFNKVSNKYQIKVNEDEVVLIALILMGKRSTAITDIINEENNRANMSQLIDMIIAEIAQAFDIDFSSDETFKVGMTLHIQNMLSRIENEQSVSNIYLHEIKRTYPMIFDISVFVGQLLEKKIHISVTEDELGFLALHIGAAYDRFNLHDLYHAIIIQPNNKAMSDICARKIQEHFGERLKIDSSMKYFELSQIDRLNPDLIITTVPLQHNLDIPTVQVSLFMNSNDEIKIFSALNELDRKRSKNEFDKSIKNLIKQEFFYTQWDEKDYQVILAKMCDNLIKADYAQEEFKESVFEREKMAETSFSYGFAVPHSLNCSTKKSCISIALLRKPIAWGKQEVSMVMLLAITEADKHLLRTFFDWLGNVAIDSQLLGKLMNATDFNEFINLIINRREYEKSEK